MVNYLNLRNVLLVAGCTALLASCKNGLFGKNKKEKDTATGWNYNDKKMGNFYVPKEKQQKTGPGLVFVTGGTFTMGATEEDVMMTHDNTPSRKSIRSFYVDQFEISNVNYRQYLYWLGNVFNDPAYENIIKKALPDTLCWRTELGYNEPLVEYYLRHPAFSNYPVVGVTWEQANDYAIWRSDRVNEDILMKKGYIDNKALQKGKFGTPDGGTFNTKSYLFNGKENSFKEGKFVKSSKNPLRGADGKKGRLPKLEDGIILPEYRLPFEAEWEYAALGYINENPNPSRKEGVLGEENISNKQKYSWSSKYKGLRDNRRGKMMGRMLANFKRGNGDYQGVAGGLNDRASETQEVDKSLPNGFNIYNMSGNVSEWCADIYRPLNGQDLDDANPYRGNVFKEVVKDPTSNLGKRDSAGRLEFASQDDAKLANRINYQRAYAINYLDGDSLSGVSYGFGITTLVGDSSRVIKGGSWADMPYWLSPGTRRYMDQKASSSTVGFRCAMDRLGSPEGNGRKVGQPFKAKRQGGRKRK
jgi:formylglycine-generating enzyme